MNPAMVDAPRIYTDSGFDIRLPRVAGGYGAIVADPPWSFKDKGSRIAPDQKSKRAAGKGYATMTIDTICALGAEIPYVAAPDSLLFLWTTSAHLVDGTALDVCKAWKFKPVTTIAWVKLSRPKLSGEWRQRIRRALRQRYLTEGEIRGFINSVDFATREELRPRVQIGMGHVTRAAHELVIVARRGSPEIRQRNIPSVIFAPRGKHSAKPDALQDAVEALVGGPYLELFSRRRRGGWTGWGAEYPGARTRGASHD